MHPIGFSNIRRGGLNLCTALPASMAMGLALTACQPTVRVQAPDKPIVINMNVKIEQDVRVRLEKGVEEALEDNPDIF